jgi:molybdopterin-binding protein
MGQAGPLRLAFEQTFASGFRLEASLDVDLAPGSLLVLFGPSAAGKTTVLRHIAGLERPDRGTIGFGTDVWCDIARNVWVPPQDRRVGLVFQEPTLFPHLSVRDNIRYGLPSDGHPLHSRRSSGGHPADIGNASDDGQVSIGLRAGRERIAEIATMLGTADLENRYPRSLSGGEARRVALARALAPGPRLLLMDEPFSALDAPTRVRLRRDVRALLQTLGTPAILVTHDRTEALAMGDVVAVVVGGRVPQVGPVADVFSRPADAAVAASLGVEAVLPARVRGTTDGLIEIDIDRVALHVAERDAVAPGSNVYACIRAEDVTLETRAGAQASTRNHLAARVVSITSEGPIDRVALDCGFPLDALITRRSREELQLVPGAHVTAAIKATSVHLVPRA